MNILSLWFGDAGHKVLVDHGKVLYNFHGVPNAIKPFVKADWLIHDDLLTISEWLDQNPKGQAILMCETNVPVPRRCRRAHTLRQIDRILKASYV